MLLTNAMLNTLTADVRTAEQALDAALAANQAIPARPPWPRSTPGSTPANRSSTPKLN